MDDWTNHKQCTIWEKTFKSVIGMHSALLFVALTVCCCFPFFIKAATEKSCYIYLFTAGILTISCFSACYIYGLISGSSLCDNVVGWVCVNEKDE